MRLIDADKTIGLLKTRLYETALNNATVNCDASQLYTECADNRIETWVDEMPTVDAVEVVRCKDCIHKPRGTRNKHDMEFPDEICPCQCEDDWYSWMPYDDWFCADGKRREDETD